MMATLCRDHPDIETFIEAKRHTGRLRHFNLSVQVTDAFMRAVEREDTWPLVFPQSHLGDDGETVMPDWPGEASAVPCRILRQIPARTLWEKLPHASYDSGESGVLFIDRINRLNNLGYCERITATNPCVSGLPVIDAEGRAVGMLTEGDLLRRVETGTEGKAPGWFASFFFPGPQAERYVHTHGRRVSEIMTPNVMSVEENTPLAGVVALMQRNRIKRLPVVRGERVVGIVSRADLVRVVGEALGAGAVTADDATIRQAILDGLAHESWMPKASSPTVAVENGVVQLDGCLVDMRTCDAIGVLAESVPGVKRVENRLVYVTPLPGIV